MIKGIATEGFKPPHLIDQRGMFLNIPNCFDFSDAQNRLIAAGNQQQAMNYILSVEIKGDSGNFTATGQPVILIPEPPQEI